MSRVSDNDRYDIVKV